MFIHQTSQEISNSLGIYSCYRKEERMRRFEDEIRQQYPEWFENGNRYPPIIMHKRVLRKVKLRTPLYVLPIILTLLVLGSYVGIAHIKHKHLQWGNERHIAALEEQVVEMDEQVSANRKSINLVAILHNENFASVRQASKGTLLGGIPCR